MRYRSLRSISPWRMVPPASHGVSRVPRYSGYRLIVVAFRLQGCYLLWLTVPRHSTRQLRLNAGPQPQRASSLVWALPISLAATLGISFDSSSSGYLDVSVPRVPSRFRVTGHNSCRVSPFGHPRICACLRLLVAFRSLPRPSSALSAKASTVCPL